MLRNFLRSPFARDVRTVALSALAGGAFVAGTVILFAFRVGMA